MPKLNNILQRQLALFEPYYYYSLYAFELIIILIAIKTTNKILGNFYYVIIKKYKLIFIWNMLTTKQLNPKQKNKIYIKPSFNYDNFISICFF